MSLKAVCTGFTYKLIRLIAVPIIISKFHPTILNQELIPKKGAIVFVANHRHKMDQFPIIAATNRVIHWDAKEEYFNGKDSLFGEPSPFMCKMTTILLTAIGCICVDRHGDTSKAKTEGNNYLKMGSAIGVFPEGTRNKTDEVLLPFKKGAAAAAKATGAWLQPAAITGDFTDDNQNLTVNFRKPFKVGSMSVEEATALLRKEVLTGIKENARMLSDIKW